jgi:diguanylate cyclase (GGDEF)-like protein
LAKTQGKYRKDDGLHKQSKKSKRRSLSQTTDTLLGLGDDLRKARVLEASLRAVTSAAVELTNSVQSSLRLLDERSRRMLTSARSGPSVHSRGAPAFKWGEGFLGWVVIHRKPALTNSPSQDRRFLRRSWQKWIPTAIMAVPLLTGNSCIGVLSVSRKNSVGYNQLDLDILRLVAQLSVPHLEIARLKRLGESDPLTLLHNRRHLQDRLPLEIQRSRRTRNPLSIAMMDIDHFKRVNDTFGHGVGDQVLCEVADRLRSINRISDVVTRWGGEEFLIIFPETNLRQARTIAERIRKTFEFRPVMSTVGEIQLTVSLGLAALKKDDDDRSLIERVDQAMYSAKRQGRNKVVSARSRG